MVKLTAWTRFLTDYHEKSGNAKLSKSMKEASKLYKKPNGKTGKHGRKRGGEGEETIVTPVAAETVVGGEDTQPTSVAPVVATGGRSRKRKGSKKIKTRRR